jgi:hypothetical protein
MLATRILFLALCAIALAPISASAANFYVDSGVSSSGNGTSWSNAWKNFSNINWNSIEPGDTIYISGGSSSKTYRETLEIEKSGTSGNPITITRGVDQGHDGTPIIDGQQSRSAGVLSDGRNHVRIKNLSIRNHSVNGIRIRNTNAGLIVEGNEVMCGNGSGSPRGIDVRNSSNFIVRGNTVTAPYSTPGQTDGIYIQANGSGWVIEDNFVMISNTQDNGHSDGLQLYDNQSGIIRGNIFIGPTQGGHNHPFLIGAQNAGSVLQFYNNVGVNRGAGNSMFLNDSGNPGTGQMVIYNNTFYRGRTTVEGVSNGIVKNNIFAPGTNGFLNDGPSDANVSNNLGYEGLTGDPKFVDPDNFDFRLQIGSAAIDKGVAINSVTTDRDGNSRPAGSSYDLGAYEYGATGGSGGNNGGDTSGDDDDENEPPQTSENCDFYKPGVAIPTDYGAAYNPRSSAREMLLMSTCNPDGSVKYTVGTGNQLHYVYNTGYLYTNAWQQFPLHGTLVSGTQEWLVGQGTYTNTSPPAGSYFWVAYVCQWTGNTTGWKCGCRDASCNQSYWQLQQAVR